MPPKDDKLNLVAPVMSEKPNYTTAKFFDQAQNNYESYMSDNH